MNDHPLTAGAPAQQPAAGGTGPRANQLALQGVVNRLVRGLLTVPLVSRGIGRRLVTLYVTGRTSGRRYTVPVAYTRDAGDLLIGTSFGWGRNLRTGEPVTIRLLGRRRLADVTVYTDEAGVTAAFALMCADNHAFANFNKIRFDPAGRPDPDDLRDAWVAGARAFRLTPR